MLVKAAKTAAASALTQVQNKPKRSCKKDLTFP
jgi:hypothetical protein